MIWEDIKKYPPKCFLISTQNNIKPQHFHFLKQHREEEKHQRLTLELEEGVVWCLKSHRGGLKLLNNKPLSCLDHLSKVAYGCCVWKQYFLFTMFQRLEKSQRFWDMKLISYYINMISYSIISVTTPLVCPVFIAPPVEGNLKLRPGSRTVFKPTELHFKFKMKAQSSSR